MADEMQTDVTNSDPAIPTDADAGTTTTTSTTEATSSESPPPEAETTDTDPLDSDTLIAGTEPTDDGDGDEAAPEGLLGAPEGDYELALPDDAPFTIAADDLAKIAPLAKEIGLSNTGLTRIVAEGVPLIQEAANRALVQDVVTTRKEWADDSRAFVQGGTLADGTEVQASPIFKGENMDAVVSTSSRAIDRFTTDEQGQPLIFPNAKPDGSPGTFNDFLKTTGLGLHPAMVHFAYRAGAAIGEDSGFERSGDTPQTKLTREEKYYPHRATQT